jgi:hypothetical protein
VALISLNDNPSDRELRQFAGIWFPLFWAAVGTFIYFNSSRLWLGPSLFALGSIVGAIGVRRVAFIRPIYLIWLYAAFPIGWTVSHLLLGAIYYGLLTPAGLVMRMVAYDPLHRRFDRSAGTYWEPAEQARQKSDYFRQT